MLVRVFRCPTYALHTPYIRPTYALHTPYIRPTYALHTPYIHRYVAIMSPYIYVGYTFYDHKRLKDFSPYYGKIA